MADSTRLAREALAKRLRELRKAAGFKKGAEFAELLGAGWSQPKVSRIETGRQMPSREDIQAWASATGADPEELSTMHQRAVAEYSTFANRYREAGGAAGMQDQIAAAESAATRIAQYEPMMVLGLLQTPEYAREMLRLDGGPAVHGADEDNINRMIASRLRRQAILHEPGRQITLVQSEAALRVRPVSPATMRAQCEHIAQLAETLTTATIAVIPFSVRVPIATLHGWAIRDDLVILETENGELQLADPAEVERYWRYIMALRDVSATGPAAAELCRTIAAGHADRD